LYYAQIRGNSLDSIILCGRLASSPDAAAYIEDQTTIPCSTAENLPALRKIIEGSDSAQVIEMLDAVVTALAPVDYLPLAPTAVRRRAERQAMLTPALFSLTAALAVVIVASIGQYYHAVILESSLSARQAEAASIETSPGYQGYVRLTERLNRGREMLNDVHSEHHAQCHAILKELSLILPDPLGLTAVDVELENGRYMLYLDGSVKLADFSPEIILAQYVAALEKSPFFHNVSVVSHQKQREGDNFNLSFQLKMDARV
jgi:hypothetical protein